MAREPTIKFWVWVPSIIESTRRGRHRSTLCKEYIGLGFHKRTAKAPPRLVLFIVKFLLGEGRTKPEKIVAEAVQLSSKQFEELLGAMISFANKVHEHEDAKEIPRFSKERIEYYMRQYVKSGVFSEIDLKNVTEGDLQKLMRKKAETMFQMASLL